VENLNYRIGPVPIAALTEVKPLSSPRKRSKTEDLESRIRNLTFLDPESLA
jgi:hypothetical protein